MELRLWSPMFDVDKEWRVDFPRLLDFPVLNRELTGFEFRPAIDLVKLAQVLPAVLVADTTPERAATFDPPIVTVEARAVARFRAGSTESLQIAGDAYVPLNSGVRTRFVVFRDQFGDDPVAVIVGTPDLSKPVPVRIHSACLTGDVETLMDVLHPDARLVADGGGKAASATRPVLGADRVARFVLGYAGKLHWSESELQLVTINGAPGLLLRHRLAGPGTYSFDIADGRIRAIYVVRNPDKLGSLTEPVPLQRL